MAVNALYLNHNGLAARGIEVPMATQPTFCYDNTILWTQYMTNCCTVATFDHANRNRTMIHFMGGLPTDDYFPKVASVIGPNTTVLMAAGSEWSPKSLRGSFLYMVQDGFRSAMDGANKSDALLRWEFFDADPNPDKKITAGSTLVLQADGQYGRVNPALQDGGKCCTIT